MPAAMARSCEHGVRRNLLGDILGFPELSGVDLVLFDIDETRLRTSEVEARRVADALGGIMRGVRTVPVLVDMAHDMEQLCPDVLHLNYVNPMAIDCWGPARSSPIRTVGLCHSVQHTACDICSAPASTTWPSS